MGFKKTLLYMSGFMVAAGGPITLFSGSDLLGSAKRTWLASSTTTADAAPAPASPQPTARAVSSGPANAAADPMPTPSLAEVLRFDVTVEWVMQRWPRVSTGLPYLQLQGYRVPLVTGSRVADVAGSLTYYFNAQQQVQRITLRGTTGNPSLLVSTLAGRYHFARRLTNDPGVVLYEAVDSSNQPVGSLKVRSARVVKASQPHARFELELAMDRAE